MVVLAHQDPGSIPDHVHLSGGAISWVDLAELIGKERGEKITMNIGDINVIKERIEKENDILSTGRYVYADTAGFLVGFEWNRYLTQMSSTPIDIPLQ